MLSIYKFLLLLTVFDQLQRPVYANKGAVGLPNVHCDTYLNYVETDTHFEHYPFIVQLYQCAGKDKNSLNYGCVPTKYTDVDVYVMKDGRHQTIKMQNVTSCDEKCLLNSTSCNKYQTLNEADCKCDCHRNGSPPQCNDSFVWDKHQCNCVCPHDPETQVCERRKSFNKEYCACMCKDKFAKRCEKQNKLLNIDTCKCIEPDYGQSTNNCPDVGVSQTLVVVIVIAELLIIIILYFVLNRFCNNPKRFFKSYCRSKSTDAEMSKTDDHKLMRNESLTQ